MGKKINPGMRKWLVEQRCMPCEYCSLDHIDVRYLYGRWVYYTWRCHCKSEKGKLIEGDLLYSCPKGKKLNYELLNG